uniref:Uncharacterized protein n=1 Tax=Plectus sambesii TaxID=2011161 RepID=A0A914WIV8_9BILA
MPSESRLDILGHADDSSYTIVTYRRTARKFVWDKTSVLVGGNGYTSHSTLCSDSRITYHAVLSYNSDDSSQELRWILEIFSPTTLERKYYSSDTTEDASANVVELVCIDSRTVVVFVAQSSVVTSELVIIKYMFTL